MKNIITTIAIICLLSNLSRAQDRTCHTIILDLSDRILVEGQIQKDIDVTQKIFDTFERKVRSQLYIKSKDIFQILIIPQKSTKIDLANHASNLRIDLSKLPLSEKAKSVKELHNNLKDQLTVLYNDAHYSDRSADYSGVDIWQYFNERLSYHLPEDAENKVYILSDGYMDFESYKHQLAKDNRYTTSRFLSKVRGSDWKDKAASGDYGFLPIVRDLPIEEISLIGMRAKVHDLQEMERLEYFWEDWFTTMEINKKNYYPSISGSLVKL